MSNIVHFTLALNIIYFIQIHCTQTEQNAFHSARTRTLLCKVVNATIAAMTVDGYERAVLCTVNATLVTLSIQA